jgi:hypothetical protein
MTSATGARSGARPGRRMAAAALVAVALGVGVWAASAGAYVYWNGQGGGVGYAYLDGSSRAPLVASAESSCGVVVDQTNIYWIDPQSQSIVEAGLDGGGAHAIVASPNVYGDSCYLAIDSGFIYWANPAEGTIGRATLSGGSPNPNVVLTGGTPEGVAVDGSYVYYTDVRDDVIGRANINGTGSGGSIIGDLDDPTSVAVSGSYIYWGSSAAGGVETIGRATLQGPTWPSDPNPAFITLPVGDAACGIALDASYIYWALPGSDSVGRAKLDGSAANSQFVASPPGGVGCGIAVDGAGDAPGAGSGTAGGGSQAAFLDALAGTSFAQGGPTPFTVPAGVSALVVDAHGADGGSGWAGDGGAAAAGGEGGAIQATIPVGPNGPITPGEQLEAFVGFDGASASGNVETSGGDPGGGPGASGAGGGGGYTALCKAGTSASLLGAASNCVLVAGGGGGGGGPGSVGSGAIAGGAGASASTGAGGGAALGDLSGGGGGPAGVSAAATSSGGAGASAGSLSELPGYAGAPGALSYGGGGGDGSGSGNGGGGGGGGFGGGGGGGGGAWSGRLSAPSVWSAGGGGGAGASLLPAGASTVADTDQPMLVVGYVPSVVDGTQPPSTSVAPGRASAGAASVHGGGAVRVTLSCSGPAGSSCQLTAGLSVTETILSGRVTALAARAVRGPKPTHRTVTVGHASLTLSGGQRRALTISLNVRGRQLLAAHHGVRARLVVRQAVDAGPVTTIKSETVSLSVGLKPRR